jgi:diguanylate cyclase (GGDEF)-like protein
MPAIFGPSRRRTANNDMKDDVRYSELRFLQALADKAIKTCDQRDGNKFNLGSGSYYVEMVATLLEELHIQFSHEEIQMLVAKLRGELGPDAVPRGKVSHHQWIDPRRGIKEILTYGSLEEIALTYRGLRRIEELRDILRTDRILEPFGVLLCMRYFRRDLEDALKHGANVPVSVIYADMDKFKDVNTNFGQSGGDVVMKSYLQVVERTVGLLGVGYRGVGDEVSVIIVGQGHEKAVEIAEEIRKGVQAMRCEYKGKRLSQVTASIGVSTTPPETHSVDIEDVAQARKQIAKDKGRNRVISS